MSQRSTLKFWPAKANPGPMAGCRWRGAIEAPTIDGTRAKVTIPPGPQSGQQFRLKGKGILILRKTVRGDMFIETMVKTPVNLTKRQQDLLQGGLWRRATVKERVIAPVKASDIAIAKFRLSRSFL